MKASSVLAVCLIFLLHAAHSFPQPKVFPVGFSYSRFSGPVSGPERQVVIPDKHGHGHPYVDYVAKPNYQFSYGVDDPRSQVQQNRKEMRFGDVVRGEYSLIQPDGSLRTVKYTADDVNGFQAEVVTDDSKTTQRHQNTPAVIPVYEPPVHGDVPITKSPPAPNYNQSPIHEQIRAHKDHNNSEYSAERSTEDREPVAYHEQKNDESGSDESKDSVY